MPLQLAQQYHCMMRSYYTPSTRLQWAHHCPSMFNAACKREQIYCGCHHDLPTKCTPCKGCTHYTQPVHKTSLMPHIHPLPPLNTPMGARTCMVQSIFPPPPLSPARSTSPEHPPPSYTIHLCPLTLPPCHPPRCCGDGASAVAHAHAGERPLPAQ